MPDTYIHDGASYRKLKEWHAHDGTAWRKLKEAWCHDGATWRRVFSSSASGRFSLPPGTLKDLICYAENGTDYELFATTSLGLYVYRSNAWVSVYASTVISEICLSITGGSLLFCTSDDRVVVWNGAISGLPNPNMFYEDALSYIIDSPIGTIVTRDDIDQGGAQWRVQAYNGMSWNGLGEYPHAYYVYPKPAYIGNTIYALGSNTFSQFTGTTWVDLAGTPQVMRLISDAANNRIIGAGYGIFSFNGASWTSLNINATVQDLHHINGRTFFSGASSGGVNGVYELVNGGVTNIGGTESNLGYRQVAFDPELQIVYARNSDGYIYWWQI